MAADERRREYNEEQRNEYENYVEEDRDGKTWIHLVSLKQVPVRSDLTPWNKNYVTASGDSMTPTIRYVPSSLHFAEIAQQHIKLGNTQQGKTFSYYPVYSANENRKGIFN